VLKANEHLKNSADYKLTHNSEKWDKDRKTLVKKIKSSNLGMSTHILS
jgi:hypothetical protein